MNNFKNSILQSVSHDLKTPLNSMVANLEVALSIKNLG